MHRRTAPAVAVLLAALLAGCGSSEEPKGSPEPAASQSTEQAPEEPAEETPVEKTLELGEPAETIGSGGTGALEVTPDTIVYATEGTGETPDNEVFAVVAIKLQPTNAVAAAQAAPIDGGGWSWIAADGQAVSTGSGTAYNVTPDGYTAGGEIQPGTHEWATAAFDLTAEQAKSGTLMYVDGAGTAHRWEMPDQDTGPQADKLKQALQ
ncbi:hypothetical protein ACLIYM_25225 [Streptomyces fenghuangensis]